jgi:hypothetical protein
VTDAADPYARFSLAAFEALDIEGRDERAHGKLRQALELELLDALKAEVAWGGVERVIRALNEHGHRFRRKRSSEGWRSYYQETNQATRDFWIHANREDDLIAVDVLYFEKLEVVQARRRKRLSAKARAQAELVDRFYDLGQGLVRHADDYATLPPDQKLHLALYLLDTGVNNGGFETYLTNTEGAHCADLPGYLRRVGALDLDRIVRELLEHFPSGFESGLSEEVWRILDARREELDALDDRYYDTSDNLALLVMQYLERERGGSVGC